MKVAMRYFLSGFSIAVGLTILQTHVPLWQRVLGTLFISGPYVFRILTEL